MNKTTLKYIANLKKWDLKCFFDLQVLNEVKLSFCTFTIPPSSGQTPQLFSHFCVKLSYRFIFCYNQRYFCGVAWSKNILEASSHWRENIYSLDFYLRGFKLLFILLSNTGLNLWKSRRGHKESYKQLNTSFWHLWGH